MTIQWLMQSQIIASYKDGMCRLATHSSEEGHLGLYVANVCIVIVNSSRRLILNELKLNSNGVHIMQAYKCGLGSSDCENIMQYG